MDAPFPDIANAGPELDAALAAGREAKRATVLVFGANWCPDARAFAAFLAEPELASAIAPRAQILLIDIGRHDRNQHLVRRFDLGRKLQGVPAVLVLDADGYALNAHDIYRWRTARSAGARDVAAWLDTLIPAPSGDAS